MAALPASLNVDFECVLDVDSHGAAQLDRKNDTAEFINLTDNTGGFHVKTLLQFHFFFHFIYTRSVKGFRVERGDSMVC